MYLLAAIQLFGTRIDRYHILLLFAAVGLAIGLFVAEHQYHKSARRTNHVMPATIIKNSSKIADQKVAYYALLVFFVACDYILKIPIPEACYSLIVFAIIGGDIQKIANKFLRLR